MNISRILEAVEFAVKAHNAQRRKFVDEPYVAHSIRVAEVVAELTQDEDAVIAALLHDVVEDTKVTFTEIEERFGYHVRMMVDELTDCVQGVGNRKRRKELDRARLGNASPLAQTIKCVDILDNTDSIVDNDPGFAVKYLEEINLSLPLLYRADPKILQETRKVVKEAEQKLVNCIEITGDNDAGC